MRRLFIIAVALTGILACRKEPAPVDPGAGITAFGFLAEDNTGLNKDLECKINEDGTITGAFPEVLLDYKMTPCFEFDGESVMAGGAAQTSRKNKHDFGKDVVYTVELKDGTQKTYTVRMSVPAIPRLPIIRINTENSYPILDKKNYIPGKVVIEDPDGAYWDTPKLEVTITENGVTFAIYDRERTICDMFKHRGKVDNEMFSKAVNAYANDTQKNLIALSIYAKKLRVYKKVMELMEVLLNG